MSGAKELSVSEVRAALDYDPETGVFVWRHRTDLPKGRTSKTWNTRFAGKPAGHAAAIGYRQIAINGRLYLAHRLAWLYVHGEWPSPEIDHVNGNGLDNRLANLRLATSAQNKANTRARSTNTSGVPGVDWRDDRGKYRARFRRKHLGYFDTAAEAAAARESAAREMYGEFVRS